jgi:hypothetical protein
VVPRTLNTKAFEEASRSFRPLSSESLLGYWQLHWLESGRWPGYEAKSKFPSQLVLTESGSKFDGLREVENIPCAIIACMLLHPVRPNLVIY